jgi:hypothetical protein
MTRVAVEGLRGKQVTAREERRRGPAGTELTISLMCVPLAFSSTKWLRLLTSL